MKLASMIYSLGALALMVASALAYAEPGNLMKISITAKMQIPGMGEVPPHTHTYTKCVQVKKPDPRKFMDNKHCALSNYNWDGDDITTKVTCTAPVNIRGNVHFTWTGDSIHGQTHMTGDMQGRPLKVDQTVEGQRIGSCIYSPSAGDNQ